MSAGETCVCGHHEFVHGIGSSDTRGVCREDGCRCGVFEVAQAAPPLSAIDQLRAEHYDKVDLARATKFAEVLASKPGEIRYVTKEEMEAERQAAAVKADGGGLRYNAGKLRYDLIPTDVMREVARVFTYGAGKYAERNWERGQKFSVPDASAARHNAAFKMGERTDAESQCHHLAHAIVNLMFELAYDLRGLDELNDHEPYLKEAKNVHPTKA